jgi:hypothetical protein
VRGGAAGLLSIQGKSAIELPRCIYLLHNKCISDRRSIATKGATMSETATFDLTTAEGAAGAAAYLINHFGEWLEMSFGHSSGITTDLQPTGVQVWRDQRGYVLGWTHKGMPAEVGGVEITHKPTTAPPPRIPAWMWPR